MKSKTIGVLAFHGDVIEHVQATKQAARHRKLSVTVKEIRAKKDLSELDGLILPGGESTTLYKLCIREGMWESMKQVPYIFGTCAGAIMLAKTVNHKERGQKTLERMDLTIDRNAYGRQTDSFEQEIKTLVGPIRAIFIRAPRIVAIDPSIKILATNDGEVVACEQSSAKRYSLACCFHPELTTTTMHEYFLSKFFSKS